MPASIYDLGTARGTIELNASSLGRASAALTSVGLGLIGVGTAAVVGFGYVVKQSADFEKIMSGAQSALGVTSAAMGVVKNAALDMGAKSIYGAKNVGLAIEELAYAGLNIKEILGGAAQATIDLAQASGGLISLDTAARTVVNTMRTFHLSASDAGHIATELAAAANKSTITIDDMVTSLRYVGPVAYAAGISLDSTSEALALLGDRGIRGSTAGTSLRGVMLGLIAPSVKATGVLKELGIITKDGTNIMFDASGKMKDFGQVAQILQDHTRGLTAQQKEAAFAAIFLRRAMASALVISDAGAAGFAHYRAEIAGGGTASQIAATRLNNLHGDLSLLHSQLQTVIIRAGTPFQNMLRGWVQNLTALVAWFGRLSPGTQKFILEVLAVGGALLIAAGSFLVIAGAIIRMYKTFRDLQIALGLLSKAFDVLGLGFLTNPIFLVIAAIVLLAVAFYLLWNRSEAFRNFWKTLWRDIQNYLQIAWRFLQRVFNDVVGWFQRIGPAALHKLQDAFRATLDWITSHWRLLAIILGGPIGLAVVLIVRYWSQITAAVRTAVDFVGRQMTLFGRWFSTNVTPTIKAFVDFLKAVFKDVNLVIQIFWLAVQPILSLFVNQFKTGTSVIVDTMKFLAQYLGLGFGIIIALFKFVAKTLQIIWGPAWLIIRTVVQVALLYISRVTGIFFAAFLAVWHPFWHALISVVQAVWTAVKAVIAAALKFIRGILELFTGILTLNWGKTWKGIKDIFGSTWDAIRAIFTLAWKLLFTAVQFAITALINFVRTVPGKILSALGDLTKLLWQKGIDIVQSLLKAVVKELGAVWTFLGTIKDKVLAFFKDAGSWLLHVGEDIIKGLIKGITGFLGHLKDSLGGIAGKIISWKGPPDTDRKLLIGNGQLLMQGLIEGLTSQLPALKAMLANAAGLIGGLGASGLAGANGLGSVGIGGATGPATIGAGASSSVNPAVHVVEKGDTISLTTASTADPREIVNELLWAKRVRS